jgi:hypothetical protein
MRPAPTTGMEIHEAIRTACGEGRSVWVAIPCVLPPTLPFTAAPPGLIERPDAQRSVAIGLHQELTAGSRVEPAGPPVLEP